MCLVFVGRPLDGASLVSAQLGLPPDLVEISTRLQVARYVPTRDGTCRHVEAEHADAVAGIAFEEWWAESGNGDPGSEEIARVAWAVAHGRAHL